MWCESTYHQYWTNTRVHTQQQTSVSHDWTNTMSLSITILEKKSKRPTIIIIIRRGGKKIELSKYQNVLQFKKIDFLPRIDTCLCYLWEPKWQRYNFIPVFDDQKIWNKSQSQQSILFAIAGLKIRVFKCTLCLQVLSFGWNNDTIPHLAKSMWTRLFIHKPEQQFLKPAESKWLKHYMPRSLVNSRSTLFGVT